MKNLLFTLSVACTLALCSPVPNAQAAAGDLDPAFATTGMLQIGFGRSDDRASAVAVQANGTILMAGTIDGRVVLVRFDTNSVLDAAFGQNGVVFTPLPAYLQFSAMRIQLDGKIVIAGSAESSQSSKLDFLVARFNPDGTPDLAFGDDGIAVWNHNNNRDECKALLIQSDGKLLLGGVSQTDYPTYNTFMALTRFETNGVLDTSFNGSGWIVATNNSAAWCLAQQSDGKLLVGGYMSTNQLFRFNLNGSPDIFFGVKGRLRVPGLNAPVALAIQSDPLFVNPDTIFAASEGTVNGQGGFLVARLTLAGALDTTFNGTGIASLAVGANVNITGLSVLFSGRFIRKVVLSGDFLNAGNQDFWLARLNINGTADTTFGTGGLVKTTISPGRDTTCGMAVQSGLRLLVAGTSDADSSNGDFALARYNWSDGSLDTNFHGTGVLVQNLWNLPAAARCVAVQNDGKLVVGGRCGIGDYDSAVALCRLYPDGTLDSTFGDQGRVVTPVGDQNSEAAAMAIQPDGKIVIAGTAWDGTSDSVMLARYLPNGTLDSSFGTNGTLTTVTGTNGSSSVALALQADGRIVVGVHLRVVDDEFAVFRYLNNGALDASWNGSGKTITGVGPDDDELRAVAIQTDGKIVASGSSLFIGTIKSTMVRYNSNGSLDASFGTFGRVATQFGTGTIDFSLAIAMQPNGKIILGGYSTLLPPAYDPDIALARYNSNGALDSTFDYDGKATTPLGLGADFASKLALQTDGKIIAGCTTQIGTYDRFGVARFLGNGAVDSGYASGGVNYFDFGTDGSETLNDMALDSNNRIIMVGEVGGLFGILRVQSDPILRLNSITHLANGHMLLKGDGVPNGAHTLLKAPALGVGAFSSFAPVTANASGNWQYEDTTSSATTSFYRLSYP